ncbi:histone deacetylase family protein [Lichenifustis flavocetrariae]|uniref:Histone deacetylase family protein n=1 Tax=Lichenifustis flavocetrariae TaxID=2949735 RepID=A0AA42CIZ7_9HYPH|nr:histone deacetylase family protein [Lichenifustis flavocetrariae]MCW6508914.1 histone deacetylase family protein [Lichenifustis flavocetrariae]
MTTLLFSHPDVYLHEMGEGHPERPDRIRAIMRRLDAPQFAALVRREAPEVSREAVERAHPAAYLDMLLDHRPPAGTFVRIDGDTVMNDGTWPAVSRAAGGAVAAVDAVVRRECANAFVATRPPGHHAERMRAMGFCFLNNVAIAARHAGAAHGIDRVAIIDFDVHHGNGTQDIFWNDPNVLYCSTHQMPLFPGTGAASERGQHGTIVNVPLPSGADGRLFRAAVDDAIVPNVEAFAPGLIILSAGFDAHRRDPLASLALVEADFAWVTRRFLDLAERHSGGRLVSVLEGGYDLEGLSASVAAHVTELMGGSTGT